VGNMSRLTFTYGKKGHYHCKSDRDTEVPIQGAGSAVKERERRRVQVLDDQGKDVSRRVRHTGLRKNQKFPAENDSQIKRGVCPVWGWVTKRLTTNA